MQIINTLGDIRRGRFLEDIDAELRAVVDAVRDAASNGRVVSGEVTIKLKVKSNASDELALRVEDSVTSRLPKRPSGESVFFATTDGGLVRQDPRQQELPLREVSSRNGVA